MTHDLQTSGGQSSAAPVRTGCWASRLTPDHSTEQLDRLADQLVAWGGLSAAETAAELSRLLALPGISVLVQLASASPGSRITGGPHADPRALLCLVGAFCCAAGHSPERKSDAATVLVLCARTDRAGEFTLAYPMGARRISMVANGRFVSAAIDLSEEPTMSFDLDDG
jgi:hypothetical protein